jgi:hypothetical protein
MDSSPPAASSFSAGSIAWPRALIALGLIIYAVFLATHVGAYAGGSDSSGYLNNARLLATGKTALVQRIPAGIDPEKHDSFSFMPLGFRPMEGHTMTPTYPIGLPIEVVVMAKIVGWRLAPAFVMALSALAAVSLMIPLGRAAGLSLGWSAFGALLLATSPLTTFMSMQFMSDVPATATATATILCAWQSRTRRRWALAAGALFALGVLIRPTNFMLIVPIALCLGFDWRRWILFGLGGLTGAIAQTLYSRTAYGDPFASGYGGELGTKFSLGIIPTTLAHCARWLPVLLTPVGLFALALPWVGRRHLFTWVLVAWIVVFFAFYIPYFHTHETWWYLRFLLPSFPACLVGGLWVIAHYWSRTGALRFPRELTQASLAIAAVIVVFVHSRIWHRRLEAAAIGQSESIYAATFEWAKQHLPGNAVIMAMETTGALVYYSDYQFVRWDTLDREHFARITQNAVDSHRPIFAVLFPYEVKDALETRIPARWTQFGAVRQVTIWQWSPGPAAMIPLPAHP